MAELSRDNGAEQQVSGRVDMDGNAGELRPSFFLWSFLAGFAGPWTGRLKRVLVNILLRLAPDQIHSGRLGTDAACSAHAGVILGSAVPVAG